MFDLTRSVKGKSNIVFNGAPEALLGLDKNQDLGSSMLNCEKLFLRDHNLNDVAIRFIVNSSGNFVFCQAAYGKVVIKLRKIKN